MSLLVISATSLSITRRFAKSIQQVSLNYDVRHLQRGYRLDFSLDVLTTKQALHNSESSLKINLKDFDISIEGDGTLSKKNKRRFTVDIPYELSEGEITIKANLIKFPEYRYEYVLPITDFREEVVDVGISNVESGFIAGKSLQLALFCNMKDGDIYNTFDNYPKVFNRDFDFEISGAAYAISSTGKLAINYTSIHHPTVNIRATLRSNPLISIYKEIPVSYNAQYAFNYSASDGYDGRDGSCGRDGNCGSDGNECTSQNGGNGNDGSDGQDGEDGDNGYHAKNVTVDLEMVRRPEMNDSLLQVIVRRSNETTTRYLSFEKGSGITIYAIGGDGGDGGDGGSGGDGGDGGDGGSGTEEKPEGNGGDGGDGGNGGNGGDGGRGGDGGDVTIYYNDSTEPFLHYIKVYNAGGDGGDGGLRGSRGGSGDEGDGRCDGDDGSNGSYGYYGDDGYDGRDGKINYIKR